MINNNKQTTTGKAFEYACAYTIFEKYRDYVDIRLLESPQMTIAKRAYDSLSPKEQKEYILGAKAAIKIVDRLEPKLADTSMPMAVFLQADKEGQKGDVRDVMCTRADGWEIGLSCKHNHEAVKHSRLSDTIDFGRDWFGRPCSKQYFDEVRKIFVPLRKLRDSRRQSGRAEALWSQMRNKEDNCYVPVLKAFMTELERLDREFPSEIPEKLIRYLIGRNDFYKVIMNEQGRFTRIEAVNINRTLNKALNGKKAMIDVPAMVMPSKFYEIGFKSGTKNTIVVVCDQGWNVSMRIHNASARVEPSLKFDVQLMAIPNSMFGQIEPWE